MNNYEIAFSADDIRTSLQLGMVVEDTGPTEYSYLFQNGAFQIMGYSGPIGDSQKIKGFLLGSWRFLMHILISVC